MEPRKNPNHYAQGAALFTDAFRGLPVIDASWKAFARQVQELETAIYDVLVKRLLLWEASHTVPYEDGSAGGVVLSSASDAQLDDIGEFVGQPRNGLGDTDYLAAIRLRIRVNRSNGRPNDVIDVATLAAVGGTVVYREGGAEDPARFSVSISPCPSPYVVADFLSSAKMGGVAGDFVFSEEADDASLTWDEGDGWGSTLDGSAGDSWGGGIAL